MENNTEKKNPAKKILTPDTCVWLTLTHVIMVAVAVALVYGIIISLIDLEWDMFLYTLGAAVAALIPCAIIQLLVKIEQNTRK